MTFDPTKPVQRRPRQQGEGVMSDFVFWMPFLLSAITIWMTLLAGNKHPKAWLVGLVNQLLWLLWIVASGSYGLLPMNIALWLVYGRNHLRWQKEPAQ